MAKYKAKTGYSPRKSQNKEVYDTVLIVAEGTTEINYFKGLIKSLKLSTVNIKILDIRQNTPDSIFKQAQKLYKKSRKSGNTYDRVYCLFDKDKHPKYKETKDNINQIKIPKKTYFVSYSEPCFEYWLLLHYKNTAKPFICFDKLRKDKTFRQYFPQYNKTNKDVFSALSDKLQDACKNAENNPHTNINELVEYLQNIKNR